MFREEEQIYNIIYKKCIVIIISYEENFVSVIGDLNIRSEFGIDTSTKLMDIFKKLGVKSAFKCVTHNLDRAGHI